MDKVACLDISEESIRAMTNSYREKALDTFIRGLNGDLPRLLSIREPATLPQALHLCQKLENMTFRLNYAQGINRNNVGSSLQKPSQQVTHFKGHGFYPELAHIPPTPHRSYGPNQHYNQAYNRPRFFPPNRTIQPNYNRFNYNPTNHNRLGNNPLFGRNSNTFNNQNISSPRPVPMEIDSSSQFRHNNYRTDPAPNYSNKRPLHSQNSHPPNKMQRNFYMETAYPYETNYEYCDTNPESPTPTNVDPNNIFPENEIGSENNIITSDNTPQDNVNFLE